MNSIKVSYSSPSNIAIVKYWGKFGEQLPMNPSFSFTLNESRTIMNVERSDSESLSLDFYFEEKKNEKFEKKILSKLARFSKELSWINQSKFVIHSYNTFPHSTGIASSASSMSALALCLVEIDSHYRNLSELDKKQLASKLSRLGSGSASRSVFKRAAIWGESKLVNSSNDFAVEIDFDLPEQFKTLQDTILIVSSDEKKVSSTAGHELMNNHPHRESRIQFANMNLEKLILALKDNDFNKFAEVSEHEALDLHSMMMTSTPSFILLEPNSLGIVKELREFRLRTEAKITFTIDAGPNIHLLYPKSESKFVEEFLKIISEKKLYKQAIFDFVGNGPEKLN